jgi:polysaccharide pyruvyl transferase WcaK-like protein
MCKIAIIGWYGTETIGDRAILAGIVCILSGSADNIEIQLGALYPVLSERTILEDYDFYKSCAGDDFSISIFDSTRVGQLKKSIKWCDILIVGGGPLMDLDGISMLDYSFRYAHSLKKKTMLLGCGWGPLKSPFFISCAHRLIKNSDSVLMRDEQSVKQSRDTLLLPLKGKRIKGLIDPAFFAAQHFTDNIEEQRKEQRISINFRDIFYDSHYVNGNVRKIYAIQKEIVRNIAMDYTDYEVLLVPMHTFYVGGDDRFILNKIAIELNLKNISVQNNPLSLEETMNKYYNSLFCVGMRFHSIVLQTTVNGKNYILDYTDPNKGKTISMIRQLIPDSLNGNRYFSLHDLFNEDELSLHFNDNITRLIPAKEMVGEYFKEYVKETQKVINE